MSNIIPHARSTRVDRACTVPPQVGTEIAGTVPVFAEPEGGYFRSHAPRLVTLGYNPVPIEPGTKRPATKDWPDRDFGEERTLRRAFSGHGLGVKTGRPNADGHALIGVDIDVLDPVVAAKLLAWCRENIGDAPLRVGQAPKAMLVFRTGKPFRKKRSRTFRSPDGEQAVEVLGTGQQFLAYAIHPVTGQPYTWDGRELVDTQIAELPSIVEQQALDFIAYFESIVPDDWEPVTRESAARTDAEQHKTSKTPLAPIWELRLALDAIPIPPGDPRGEWIKIGMALYHSTEGAEDGLALWVARSSEGEKYMPGEPERLWRGFGAKLDGAHLSAATIFRMADQADPRWRDRARKLGAIEHDLRVQRLVDIGVDDARDTGEPAPLKTFSLAEFEGKPLPERKWIVEGLVPDRNVTDLSGDGGTGKSLLALQLGVAMAGGGKWLGGETIRGGVLYVSAEDERDEIQRRAALVAASEGLSLAALDRFHVADLTREPSTELAKVDPSDRQSLRTTDLFDRIEAVVATLRPKLMILDTRADVYGGNEIDRVQVRTFIRMLQLLCRSYDLAILLLSHPSRAGMTTGDGQSGSTGWGNSVRSRLYLKRPDDKGGDPDRRELSSEKANYGALGASIPLRWRDGVFVVEGLLVGGKVPDRQAREHHVDERFMQQLADAELRGEYVNGNKTGQRYAPRVFAKLDASSPDRIGEKPYEAAMWRLKSAGRLANGKTDGPPAKRYDKLIAVDLTAPLRSLAERQGVPHD